MGHPARSAHRFHIETLLNPLVSVLEPLPAAQDDGDDHEVHVVDQVGDQELADG